MHLPPTSIWHKGLKCKWQLNPATQLGRKLRKFTQLKRNKRFDNFIMLVWVQESPFHIAAGSLPVQEAWGSQDSLYRGQIHKFLQCCREPYQQISLVITIQKKYCLTYLRRTISYLLKERSKVNFLALGVKQVKWSNFAGNGLKMFI